MLVVAGVILGWPTVLCLPMSNPPVDVSITQILMISCVL